MAEYRVGSHHGITICREGDGYRCGRDGHDCDRGHLGAVVVRGFDGRTPEQEAEWMCARLNAADPAEPEIRVTKMTYAHPMADGECTHGRVVRYNLAVGVIVHIFDDSTCTGEVVTSPRHGAVT